ncbi:hypothetical protein [Paraglaciecola sp.]|uniref:hypothetical protein n=1 Tax=Paraglaciecola sp. TaxID=1920173 RepID=UPI003EF2DD87
MAVVLLFLVTFLFFNSPVNDPVSQFDNQTEIKPTPSISIALDLWRQKQYHSSLAMLEELNQPQSEAGFYEFYFKTFVNGTINQTFSQQAALPSSCSQQLLFVAGSVNSLTQAEKLKQKLINDQRLQSLPICAYELIWFNPETVQCTNNQTTHQRISCDLPLLAQHVKSLQFTHLVIFAKDGKANVHNGIMYLDQQDTYDVFVHELAHFAGFVDEYPLSAELAKQVCQQGRAPNLRFSKPNDSTNLSPARTCDNHPNQAYKNSKRLTFMEYHDVAYIPEQYLTAWRNSLLDQHNSPSAHVNFAQFYEEHNNVTESQYWRAKYKMYLTQ